MATPPLPDVPCVRVRLIFSEGSGLESGVRFYLKYSGAAPTGANCTTLAGLIATDWGTYIAPLVNAGISLTEVDVLDIATNSGLSGQWNGTPIPGTNAGTALPFQVAQICEFGIARRYRGGKPRVFWPAPVEANLATQATYQGTWVTSIGADTGNFFAHVVAHSVGSMGTLGHVNLSYFSGFNTATPPWRGPGFKYPPKYRAVALHDDITGYFGKATLGSQKRRRTSTTP